MTSGDMLIMEDQLHCAQVIGEEGVVGKWCRMGVQSGGQMLLRCGGQWLAGQIRQLGEVALGVECWWIGKKE